MADNKTFSSYTYLGVLSYIVTIILHGTKILSSILPLSSNTKWMEISNLAENTYNLPWMKFVYYNLSSYLFILICSIIVAIFFFKRSRYFPTSLVLFLMISILRIAILFYLQTVIKGPATPTVNEIVLETLRSVSILAIWIPYILLSDNAREIFIN